MLKWLNRVVTFLANAIIMIAVIEAVTFDGRLLYEPVHEKTNNFGFQPSPTQTRLYSHRSRLEA